MDFDIDYVTLNNSSSWLCTVVNNAMQVFYDCPELRDLHQTFTQVLSCDTSAW